ncbi:barnase inhibitor (plasmid) [Ketogulonicigenium robustum]|uniref:Barnase inhibitor n=1 Tax=Ketogulonicigenium robustum TaxID=92947 RepID=A0A1W6P2U2_9RHOB|nr:barstar family protein [Ketogulonicigenium robustum]ARO15832.1 barnase inhibitor [Ketogulonicigenium robustum]
MATFTLDGRSFDDIPGFYRQINALFMTGAADWALGDSLDALDDMLYGGYGRLAEQPDGPHTLIWTDSAKSETDLGRAATEGWLRAKIARPDVYAPGPAARQLAALLDGSGQTYFQILVELFNQHPNITLSLR